MGTVQDSEECKSSISSVFISRGLGGWAVPDEDGRGKEHEQKGDSSPRRLLLPSAAFFLMKEQKYSASVKYMEL